jgi:hypothetical protein
LAKAARLCACVVALTGARAASAVTFKVASTGGLMQQPTSHYYHAVYGGYVEAGADSDAFVARFQYVERPEFDDAGYADKDYGSFGMIGTKVTKAKDHGLYAFFGGGRMAGYVRAQEATRGQTAADERSYALPGPTVAVEYQYHWKRLALAVNHQSFVGYVDKAQTDAYVAWPFNFFQVTAGVVW